MDIFSKIVWLIFKECFISSHPERKIPFKNHSSLLNFCVDSHLRNWTLIPNMGIFQARVTFSNTIILRIHALVFGGASPPPLADFKILLRLWPHASAQLLPQLPRRGRQAPVAALFGQLWGSQDPQGVAMNRQETAKVTYRKLMGNPFGYVIKIYRKVQ